MENLFDFTKVQRNTLNPLSNALNTAPSIGGATGGGQTPPTQQSQPLPDTQINMNELDENKIKEFISRGKQLGKSKQEIKVAYDKAMNDGFFKKTVVQTQITKEPLGVTDTLQGIGQKTAKAVTEGASSAAKGLGTAIRGIGSNIYQATHGMESSTDIGRPLIEGLIGAGRVVTSPIEGVVSQGIEQAVAPIIEYATPQSVKDSVKDLAKEGFANVNEWYQSQSEPVKQLIKDLGLTAEGALNLLGAKVSPKAAEQVLKGSTATVEGLAQGAKATGETIATGAQKTKNLLSFVPSEEKQAAKILGETVEGVVDGQKVQIPKPTSTLTEKITSPVRTSDTKVLAGRAIAPRASGMQPKQKIGIVANTEKNAKDLYNMVRTGKISGDINTLEDAAQTVVSGLDEVGAKIGEAVKGAKGMVSPSKNTIDDALRIFSNDVDMKAAAAPVLKDFIETVKNGRTIQDAFKAKKIFSAEISKLSKAGDGGTDAYAALVKGVHELDKGIDDAVSKTLIGPQHAELKSQYATLKKLAGDIVQSAMVEGRRAPQTLAEQMGMLQTISDIIKNPLSGTYRATAGALVKDMAELNTRGGAWKEFVKIMDKQAIKNAKNPQKVTVAKPLKKSTIDMSKPLKKTTVKK